MLIVEWHFMPIEKGHRRGRHATIHRDLICRPCGLYCHLVLVFQLFIWGRSEPPKDNSLAWAELLSARAMVTWPTPLNPGYNFAKNLAARTVEKIDQDRAVPKC